MSFVGINPEVCSRCGLNPPNPTTLTNLCSDCAVMLSRMGVRPTCTVCGRPIEPEARFFTNNGQPRHMLCEDASVGVER